MGHDRDAAQDIAQDRVTVQEAARRLGVKEDAVRKRIQRGSIRHQKGSDGRVWVWVRASEDEFRDAGGASHDAAQDTSQDAYKDTAQDGRLEDLREQVAYLRRQLDEEREARRRADTILVQLSAANAEQARTIRALEAPASPEVSEDAQTVEEAPEGPRERPAAPSQSQRTEEEPTRRPWWRRVFGG